MKWIKLFENFSSGVDIEAAVDDFMSQYPNKFDYENWEDAYEKVEKLSDVEFFAWLKPYLLKAAKDLVDKLYELSVNNKLRIFRKILVKEDWYKKFLNCEIDDIGKYWAFTINKAISHHGNDNEINLIVESEIDLKDINWNNTIVLHLIFEGKYSESEVCIKENVKLPVKCIYIDNKIVNITNCLKNKVFITKEYYEKDIV